MATKMYKFVRIRRMMTLVCISAAVALSKTHQLPVQCRRGHGEDRRYLGTTLCWTTCEVLGGRSHLIRKLDTGVDSVRNRGAVRGTDLRRQRAKCVTRGTAARMTAVAAAPAADAVVFAVGMNPRGMTGHEHNDWAVHVSATGHKQTQPTMMSSRLCVATFDSAAITIAKPHYGTATLKCWCCACYRYTITRPSIHTQCEL